MNYVPLFHYMVVGILFTISLLAGLGDQLIKVPMTVSPATAPKLRVWVAEDGTSLAYRKWGANGDGDDPRGAVLYFAGLAGSSLEHFGVDTKTPRTVVTIDRPGLAGTPLGTATKTRYLQVARAANSLMESLGYIYNL